MLCFDRMCRCIIEKVVTCMNSYADLLLLRIGHSIEPTRFLIKIGHSHQLHHGYTMHEAPGLPSIECNAGDGRIR